MKAVGGDQAGVRQCSDLSFGLHPAAQRFRAQPASEERLLIIRAPDGTEPEWFATSWIALYPEGSQADTAGDQVERILRWDSAREDATALVQRLGTLLAAHTGPFAVLASANAPIYDVVAAYPCRTADPTDLLLTVDEISAVALLYRKARHQASSPEPEVVYRLTGGWLVAVRALLASPQNTMSARRALAPPLLRWLKARDRLSTMVQAAFLPEFSEAILTEFDPAGIQPAPTLHELATEGLLRADGQGAWFMPKLVQQCLTNSLRESEPKRVEAVVRAAVEATAQAGRVATALEAAVTRRAWSPFDSVLANRSAELFTSDARSLRTLLARIPEPVRARMDHLNVALRILNTAGPEGMVLPLPSVKPDLQNDRTARRLAERAQRMYQTPDARAVAYGLLEISHLRLAGHYAAAAEAALRLRQAVQGAMDTRPISLPLASIADQHAGLSLHLADRLEEASLAYHSALHWARNGNHAYLEADALSKLALLSAHQGEIRQARSWLDQLPGPLAEVRWGRKMVSRCARLAQVSCALAELDLTQARQLLAQLPAEPDTDEFWSAHAQLLAQLQTLQGHHTTAMQQVLTWRRERPYASRSPLADRLLTEAYQHASITAGVASEIPNWHHNPALANLEAYRCLRIGSVDGALRALSSPPRTGRQQQSAAALLQAYASHTADSADAANDLMQSVARIHSQHGELADLVPLHHLGLLPALRQHGVIHEDDAARLSVLPQHTLVTDPRPELTPRERDVLRLLRQGMTRTQIAQNTFRSESTIKGQFRSLYKKLGATSVQDALERSRHFGL